jgi:plastocyanin
MKKYLIGAIVVIFVIIGAVYVGSRVKTTACPPGSEPAVTIEMNSSGFTPDKITIKRCVTVTFKNVGTEPHWPASNIHPTHLIYPEFDPKRGIPAGESWSFTFDKAGVWRMHDHLSPDLVGTVTVTE